MVIKFKDVEPRKDGVVSYPIKEHQNLLKHIAYRTVTPDNPFGPHAHEGLSGVTVRYAICLSRF